LGIVWDEKLIFYFYKGTIGEICYDTWKKQLVPKEFLEWLSLVQLCQNTM
jgi:hypothetical protein